LADLNISITINIKASERALKRLCRLIVRLITLTLIGLALYGDTPREAPAIPATHAHTQYRSFCS
jgi:hypothetical protein